MGRGQQPFSKEFAAKDAEECAEFAYSIIGSNHGVKRKFIRIDNIEEIKNPEEIEDNAVRDRLDREAGK
jgi:ribosomal protein L20A (L18A)